MTLVVALFAIVSLSAASRCRHVHGCYGCTELNGCGWCQGDNLCLSGSLVGPFPKENQTCADVQDWAWDVRDCCTQEMWRRQEERERCDRRLSCEHCGYVGNGCVWCMPRDGGQGSCVSGGPHGPTNATCGRWINEPSECYYVGGIPYGRIWLIVMLGFLSGVVFASIITCVKPCLSSNLFRGLLDIIDGISLVLCVVIICTIQIGGVLVGVIHQFSFFLWKFIMRRYGTASCSFTGDRVLGLLNYIIVLGFYAGLMVDDVARRGDSVFALACFSVFSGYILGTAAGIVIRWKKNTAARLLREVEDVESS